MRSKETVVKTQQTLYEINRDFIVDAFSKMEIAAESGEYSVTYMTNESQSAVEYLCTHMSAKGYKVSARPKYRWFKFIGYEVRIAWGLDEYMW